MGSATGLLVDETANVQRGLAKRRHRAQARLGDRGREARENEHGFDLFAMLETRKVQSGEQGGHPPQVVRGVEGADLDSSLAERFPQSRDAAALALACRERAR